MCTDIPLKIYESQDKICSGDNDNNQRQNKNCLMKPTLLSHDKSAVSNFSISESFSR